MKITILIPAYNEEQTIKDSVLSCLHQTKKAHHIIVVDDWSTDKTGEILDSFWDTITVLHLSKNTWNKSIAQQVWLKQIKDKVFIATDADTILDINFVKEIEKSFRIDRKIVAVCGYVKSIKNNWLTACRELEYIIWQDLHKSAQSHVNSILILPWCCTAYKTKFFKKHITFDHDTIAEDLDFSYKINNYKKSRYINFNKHAIVYTQDPNTIYQYIHQLRRWAGWWWQNLRKHVPNVNKLPFIFEIAILYLEWIIYSIIIFILPFINLRLYLVLLLLFFIYSISLGIYGAITRKRIDLFFYSFFLIIPTTINSYIFLSEFYKQIIRNQKILIWFKPQRRKM